MFFLRNEGRSIGNIMLDSLAYEIYDLKEGLQVILERNTTSEGQGFGCSEDIEEGTEFVKKTTDPCENHKLKILYLVTPAAKNEFDDADLKVYLSFFQLNEIWRHSQINKTANFAGIKLMSNLFESSSIKIDLNNWRTNSSVLYERSFYDADFVVFVTGSSYVNQNGLAQQIGASKANAFCAVSIQTISDDRYVGAHEISHLMGASHHDDTAPYRGNVFKTGGWPFKKERHTVMSDKDKHKARIPNLFNPAVDSYGEPTGDGGHRAAQIVDVAYDYQAEYYLDSPLDLYANLQTAPDEPCSLTQYASVDVFCEEGPITYQWEKSLNGINWLPLTSSNSSLISFQLPNPIPYPGSPGTLFSALLIRCTVSDGFNTAVVRKTAWGLCYPELKSSAVISKPAHLKLQVFPNPSSGSFNLEYYSQTGSNSPVDVNLYSLSGQLLKSNSISSLQKGVNLLEYDIKDLALAEGAYIIELIEAAKKYRVAVSIVK